jgi:hypothetical protein
MTFGTQTEILPWYSKNTRQNLRTNSAMFDMIRRQKTLIEYQASR